MSTQLVFFSSFLPLSPSQLQISCIEKELERSHFQWMHFKSTVIYQSILHTTDIWQFPSHTIRRWTIFMKCRSVDRRFLCLWNSEILSQDTGQLALSTAPQLLPYGCYISFALAYLQKHSCNTDKRNLMLEQGTKDVLSAKLLLLPLPECMYIRSLVVVVPAFT